MTLPRSSQHSQGRQHGARLTSWAPHLTLLLTNSVKAWNGACYINSHVIFYSNKQNPSLLLLIHTTSAYFTVISICRSRSHSIQFLNNSDSCISFFYWFYSTLSLSQHVKNQISFNIPILGVQTQMPRSNVIYIKWLSSNASSLGSLAPLPLCSWWVHMLQAQEDLPSSGGSCFHLSYSLDTFAQPAHLPTSHPKSFNINHCSGREPRCGDTHSNTVFLGGVQ